MTLAQLVFNGAAAPLVVAAAVALWLMVRDVLLPAWSRRELSLKHHGMPLALAVLMAADLLQTAYYASGRLFPELRHDIWSNWGQLTALRIIVMSGSLIAIAAYAAIADWRVRLPHIVAAAVALWLTAIALLALLL